jgi:hypothetical protein
MLDPQTQLIAFGDTTFLDSTAAKNSRIDVVVRDRRRDRSSGWVIGAALIPSINDCGREDVFYEGFGKGEKN